MMKKILLVDDEPEVVELLQGFLESENYTVITCPRASEVLAVLELERPQVVLMDVVMPDMDGITCLKEIKKKFPETIVVLVSGLQNESVAKEAIRYGAYDYVTKPFNFEELNSRILSRLF